MDKLLEETIQQARENFKEGNIPVTAALVIDDVIVGRGAHRYIVNLNQILHAEMDAIQNAGVLQAKDFQRATLITTLSPCEKCSIALVSLGISKIIIADNRNFHGAENMLRKQQVELDIVNDKACIQLLKDFIKAQPQLWNEIQTSLR